MPPAFEDRSRPPTEADLAEALGRTKRHWDLVLEHGTACDGVTADWMFYGPKYGWTLKLVRKKRAVLYMAPGDRCFNASMALREDAVAGLAEAGLPADLVEEIRGAKPFPEGRPARLRVTNLDHVRTLRRLVALKLASLARR